VRNARASGRSSRVDAAFWGAPMTREQQTAYWKQNLRYVVVLLAIWFAVSYGAAILFADWLDRFRLAGFPLGFWFGQQGSMLVFLLLIVAYVRLMNALDRRFGVFED
jgi:putative solute:sodium symporter small subunit